ncbi:MAG TPA: hypothetical protein VE974_23030 [Thermoanaerobaculia bacterium]|nr:hypothetical protein [Thermoanaerobaculia bacterium]
MIRVLQWGLHWTFFAFCGAVIAGFSFDGRLELLAQPVRTMARTGTILVAVALATPLYFAFEVWLAGVHWVRSQYPRGSIWKPVLILNAAVLAVAGLYSWLGVWALRLAWRTFERWSLAAPGVTWVRPQPNWMYWLGLTGITILLAYFFVFYAGNTIRNYKRSLRGLGIRRFLRGLPLMVLLRLRQPRRDFFVNTPVIGELPIYAVAAGLAAFIPIPFFAVALPSLLAAVGAIVMLDRLRPRRHSSSSARRNSTPSASSTTCARSGARPPSRCSIARTRADASYTSCSAPNGAAKTACPSAFSTTRPSHASGASAPARTCGRPRSCCSSTTPRSWWSTSATRARPCGTKHKPWRSGRCSERRGSSSATTGRIPRSPTLFGPRRGW